MVSSCLFVVLYLKIALKTLCNLVIFCFKMADKILDRLVDAVNALKKQNGQQDEARNRPGGGGPSNTPGDTNRLNR